ncbi:MAG: phosphatidate cytidylyltransferase [Dehalococcoidia bacterium]|nr:phosphatidate cytidylyltransferase [Dehalococcoidia bacterium]
MLITRLATAAVGIPLVAGAIWIGDLLLPAVVALAAFVAVVEIAHARDAARTPLALLSAGLAATLPFAAFAGLDWLLGGIVLAILVLSAAFVIVTRDPALDIDSWLWGLASALYFGALAAHFILLREAPNGRDWLFFAVLTVWTTDTGAYFLGRAIGRHKLAPAISPGKTIEGALGGLATGLIAVFVLDWAFDLGLAAGHLIALGLTVPIVTQAGDLAESAIKRALAVKDSSGLIPGHGGVADRLDSLLFAAPAVYYYLDFIIYR